MFIRVDSIFGSSPLDRHAYSIRSRQSDVVYFVPTILCMQLGDVRGILGVIIMFLTKLFDFFLVPKKYDLLTTGHAGNTALYWYKGKLLALMDLSFPFLARICAGVVESVSEFTFGGTLEHACTAHPKLDPKTGELLAVGYGCAPHCTYTVNRALLPQHMLYHCTWRCQVFFRQGTWHTANFLLHSSVWSVCNKLRAGVACVSLGRGLLVSCKSLSIFVICS